MGFGLHFVEALIRERAHRPLAGDVVMVGRQTVYHTPADALALFRRHGVDVGALQPSDIEIDRRTVNRMGDHAGLDLISDQALFRLLGVPTVLALDHSDYEGAEIIHDLAQPLPEHLTACADFIADGSTLDNVFDPAMVIRNFAAMLRPGGRLMTINACSNHYEPYAVLPPLWFLDYFVINGFADCKVYIMVYVDGAADVFTVNLDTLLDAQSAVSAFTSPHMMATLVLAEKGPASTSDSVPSQQHYRSPAEWARYRENLQAIARHPRHHLARSAGPIRFDDVKRGHLFMADDFTARDPTTEIRKRAAAA